MLLALNNPTTLKSVFAWEKSKADGPFYCPECRENVHIKKGQIITHHFAHTRGSDCDYGGGETEAHRQCKMALFKTLSQSEDVDACEMEKDVGGARPDLLVTIGQTRIAIEIQRSNLSLDHIELRTTRYHRKGIFVLWLLLWDEIKFTDVAKSRFRPRIWEQWLHALYFGRVYYWRPNPYGVRKVRPVHFADCYRSVEATDWGGGYIKRLKLLHEVSAGPWTDILEGMVPRTREPIRLSRFSLPASHLYMDKHRTWW